ncbi:hypothetical protein SNE40_009145 [Patella caerulea]|uniref:G-protein coupled receptors family 1 profile domain-containing protein n=1 Tax=Patella caerulea TaxID=87958 RepID=A0AAN8JQF9_PATCE
MEHSNNTLLVENQTFLLPNDEIEETYTEQFPFAPIVCTVASIGVIGNILIVFMTFHKNISQHSYAIYLRITAISDTMVLFQTAIEDILDYLDLLKSFHQISYNLCKVWRVCYSLFRTTSPWFVVVLSLDRCIAIWKPLHKSRYCAKKAAWVACLVVFCLALVGNITMLSEVLAEEQDNMTFCGERIDDETLNTITYFTLLLQSALPCVMLMVLNIMVVIKIKQSLNFRRSFSTTERSNNTTTIRTTLPLILVSALALMTLLPIAITQVYETIHIVSQGEEYAESAKRETVDTVWSICNIIYLINFAQNCFILIGSSKQYRRILCDIICNFRFRSTRPIVTSCTPTTVQTELSHI